MRPDQVGSYLRTRLKIGLYVLILIGLLQAGATIWSIVRAKHSPSARRAQWIQSFVNESIESKASVSLSMESCQRILQRARALTEQVKAYDASYSKLAYPGGDVPLDRGVCSDLIVRGLRALDRDLQMEVHADMRESFEAYPQIWWSSSPDPNIDHRRVPNLMRFFARHEHRLALTPEPDYRACDIVAWDLGGGVTHMGWVSDQRTTDHRPLVIHHLGASPREEDVLLQWKRIGVFRLKARP
ncbi:MAG TPA: DUF1287 domain-containing protein [Pseudobdellovibrionaceae bacterium]|nr:DUF1287 domain-containing protein [Pseudobdellovibrionaceae bacterium]